MNRPTRLPRMASPTTSGRWALVTRAEPSAADRLAASIFAQLDRYGVVTRGSVLTEDSEGGFGAAYRALSALEESGQCRRGYFVEGLGAAQFALTGAVDRLRSYSREPEDPVALVLAACDPANPYGAALPWPEREGHRPGRKPGALVVLVGGALIFALPMLMTNEVWELGASMPRMRLALLLVLAMPLLTGSIGRLAEAGPHVMLV